MPKWDDVDDDGDDDDDDDDDDVDDDDVHTEQSVSMLYMAGHNIKSGYKVICNSLHIIIIIIIM